MNQKWNNILAGLLIMVFGIALICGIYFMFVPWIVGMIPECGWKPLFNLAVYIIVTLLGGFYPFVVALAGMLNILKGIKS